MIAGAYREHRPCAALAPYVECYWTKAKTAAPAARVYPDGCIDLLFEAEEGGSFVACAVGTMSRPFVVPEGGPSRYVGVRFLPGKAVAFLRVDAAELTDESVVAGDLGVNGCAEIADRLNDAHTVAAQVAALETYLLGTLARGRIVTDPYVDATVALLLRTHGAVRVEELSQVAGISRQHLARCFRAHIGLPPKTFARIVRFRAALAAMRRAKRPDWAAMASDLQYSDQAHLIADFREFAGMTPGGVFQISNTAPPPPLKVIPEPAPGDPAACAY